jgi:hypothetical protein
MEVPFLACSTVLSLDDQISIGCVVDVSTLTQSGNDMEVFVNNHSIVSIPFSGSWLSLPVLDIDEIPLLVSLSVVRVHVDVSVFSVNSS